jgi:hypothetical protein
MRAPRLPQNFISAAMSRSIGHTAWLAKGPQNRRHEAPVLDALLAAHCKQVPLGSACPLILRKLACMMHCRRR